MKAIVLSAGQGRRLLPLTSQLPKCLLALDGERTLLQIQLEALARCGVGRAQVVTGYGADQVEAHLEELRIPGIQVETLFNPFFASSDNLMSCWLARSAMEDDFILLNGDTLFEDDVLRRLLSSAHDPITVTVDHKRHYDDDDMKVALDARGRVLAIGKTLPLRQVHLDRGKDKSVELKSPIRYTPTFVLVEDGKEKARIEGYPGEFFFWGVLEKLLL